MRDAVRGGCCLAALIVAVVGCAPLQPAEERTERPASAEDTGMVGNVWLVEEADDLAEVTGDKVLVVTFRFRADGVDHVDSRVVFGAGGVPRTDGHDLRLTLMGANGAAIAGYQIRDPRRLLVEHRGIVEVRERLYTARFPFEAEAREVHVHDRRGRVLARTNVQSAIQSFCREVRDPD